MKSKLMTKIATTVLASYLALAPMKAKAQEIRDPTQAQKRVEIALAIKSEQGFSGRIWRHHPVPVVQANGSLELKLPAIGAVSLEGFTWACYDYESVSGEFDLGAKISKKISRNISLSAEANMFSYKVREPGKPIYVYFLSANFIKDNFGVNASFDFRNLKKYELSASYLIPISKKFNYRLKAYLRNSYTYGLCADFCQILSLDDIMKNTGLYANLKLMKAFEKASGETEIPKARFILEAGARYQW